MVLMVVESFGARRGEERREAEEGEKGEGPLVRRFTRSVLEIKREKVSTKNKLKWRPLKSPRRKIIHGLSHTHTQTHGRKRESAAVLKMKRMK